MKHIIDWLISMEHMAGEFYGDAASLLKEDKKLRQFLDHLAKDEAWHFHMMGSASDFVRRRPQPPVNLTLDQANKTRIEAPFRKNKEKIIKGTLTKESTLDCIVSTEFSEWNYFFAYVVNILKEKKHEFTHFAAKIEHHKKMIERYVENLPDGGKYLRKIQQLPKVWKIRILLVEYNRPLCTLISQLLSRDGIVEISNNGDAGLQKISRQYYDMIIVNAFMPDMNGVDFYKQAALLDPLIATRILFLVDTVARKKYRIFVQKNKIRYLMKPFSVGELQEVIHDTLNKTPRKIRSKVLA